MDPVLLTMAAAAAIAAGVAWWLNRKNRKSGSGTGGGRGTGNGNSGGSGSTWDDQQRHMAQLEEQRRLAEERAEQQRKEALARKTLEGDSEIAAQLLDMAGMAHLDPQYASQDQETVRSIAARLDELQLQILSVAAHPHGQFEEIDLNVSTASEPVGYPTDDVRVERLDEMDDLSRVLPDQLALDDDLFTAALASDELLVSQPYETTHVRRRLYILLDISGSMDAAMSNGLPRIAWAAGVVLQLLMRAIRGEAQFLLRYFDSEPHALIKIEDAEQAQQFMHRLLRILANGGGTDIAAALRKAVHDIRGANAADIATSDILLLSDGESTLDVASLRKQLGDDVRLHVALMGKTSSTLKAVATSYREYS